MQTKQQNKLINLTSLSFTSQNMAQKTMLTHTTFPSSLPSSSHHLKISTCRRPITAAKYSISHDQLQSQGFSLHTTQENLNIDHLNTIFTSVGFPKRDPDKIKLALDNTSSMVWIEHNRSKKPVAFARATGDDVFNAIIWDVVVAPNYQGLGLGKAVMERLIEELVVVKGICNIALYSEPRVLGFYRPLGFVVDPDGIRGMVYSKKQNKKKKK